MQGYTTTFTYGNATGSGNLFTITDSSANTGTGYLFSLATAAGSGVKPLRVIAGGTDVITVNAAGAINLPGLNASRVLFTDGSKNITSTGTVGPDQGGTGVASYTAGDFLYATAATTLSKLSLGTANQLLGVNNAGTAPEYKTLSGTANQISVTNGAGSVSLSLPQSIATSSTPSFASLTLSSATNQLTLGTTNTTTISSLAPSSARTATIPALTSSDTFAFLGQAQTFTNKTISAASNTISGLSVSNFTSPNISQWTNDAAYITASSADTLTNKTISGSSNTLTNISNSALTNSSLTVTAGSGLSGGGAVSLGGSVTLANAGVTSTNSFTGAVTIVGGGINTIGNSSGTITITGTEADTLASVTARGASSATALTLSNVAPITFSGTTPTLTFSGGNTTFDFTGAGTRTLSILNSTASQSANLDLSDGALLTNGTTRLTNTGALQNISDINASGIITFGGLNTAGVVHTNGSGVLSTGAVNLGSEVAGTLGVANGGPSAKENSIP
jgi:hypothetical protein